MNFKKPSKPSSVEKIQTTSQSESVVPWLKFCWPVGQPHMPLSCPPGGFLNSTWWIHLDFWYLQAPTIIVFFFSFPRLSGPLPDWSSPSIQESWQCPKLPGHWAEFPEAQTMLPSAQLGIRLMFWAIQACHCTASNQTKSQMCVNCDPEHQHQSGERVGFPNLISLWTLNGMDLRSKRQKTFNGMMATPNHRSSGFRDKSKGLDQDWEEIANMSSPFHTLIQWTYTGRRLIPSGWAVASI